MALDARIRRRLRLRDLDTVLAVAQYGSMAKAAAQLAVSQPAVSKAIAEIEQTLGVRLFDRLAQGVEPTIYGHALLKWAAAVFDDVRQGVKEIEFLADPAAGELRIGASEPILGGFLAAVIGRLHRLYPRITFDVSQTPTVSYQHRALRERSIDLVIGRLTPGDLEADLAAEILFEEPWSIVVGAKNPLARRRNLTLAELLQEPWTIPAQANVAGRQINEAFQAIGLDPPRSVVTCSSIQLHLALLTSGPFLAVFPRSLLRFSTNRMAIKVLRVELPGHPPPVGIVMLKNRTMSPVVERLVTCAREVAATLESPGRPRQP